MKNNIGLILILLASHQAESQNGWEQKNNFPAQARESAISFSTGGKGYVAIGTQGGTYYTDFWEYNPASDQWSQKADFIGEGRKYSAGMSVNGNAYIGTGMAAAGLKNDFFEYNSSSGAWVQKTNFAASPRQKGVAFSIGSKGYMGTGMDHLDYYEDFWEYDPATDTWTQKANAPGRKKMGAVGFSIGNRGYCGLGFDSRGEYRKDVWEFIPEGNYWRRIPDDFPGVGREDAVSFGIDEYRRGYILCGYFRGNSFLKDAWALDQVTQLWSRLPDVGGTGRRSAIGFAIGTTIYVGMGIDSPGVCHADLWSYAVPPPVTATPEVNDDFSRIFPNPFSDFLSIEIDAEGAVFSLYNLDGKVVDMATVTRGKNILPVASLPDGTYLYAIRSGDDKKISFGKIMKAE